MAHENLLNYFSQQVNLYLDNRLSEESSQHLLNIVNKDDIIAYDYIDKDMWIFKDTKIDGVENLQPNGKSSNKVVFDKNDQYMYFKAGVYNQNNSGEAADYVQATFYQLENSHDHR